MSNRKKVMTEISLWKKRYIDSRRVLKTVYKDLQKDAKKAYQEVVK